MKWTEEQKRAIDIRDCNVLVSAAAGSGKTAVLTERIRKLIVENEISIENMLIVTFSNAAASEMKEKILKAISEAVDRETNPEKQEFLRCQSLLANGADISTFHKFAMNIIRKYFYLVGIEPGFSICDDPRRQIIISDVLDNLISEKFEEDNAYFSEFMARRTSVKNDNGLRQLILEIYTFIMSLPNPFSWLDNMIDALNVVGKDFENSLLYTSIFKNVKLEIKSALDIANKVADDCSGIPSILEKAELDLARIEELCEKNTFSELANSISKLKYERFIAKKDEKEEYNIIKEMVTSKRDNMKAILKDVQRHFLSIPPEEQGKRIFATYKDAKYLGELIKEFHKAFTEEKKGLNLLDFNDLEHIALEILKNNEVAEEYHKKFEVIFVDEYQDSSVIQETLIGQVSRGNNLFMVGDVKQSIYKFRQAEPEIFIDKYNRFENGLGGVRIDLNKNFRSKKYIIKAVNAIFSKIMGSDLGGIVYDDAASLKQGISYEGELDRPVSLHIIDKNVDENLKDNSVDLEELAELKSTEVEALYISDLVKNRIGQRIFDQKTGKVRIVNPGDIVILLRNAKNRADIYAEALKNVGISTLVDIGDNYFNTNEIEVFLNLLRIIDNKKQDIPLISVLKSPIFGFTVDELVDIRLAYKGVDYNIAFELCASGSDAWEQYKSILGEIPDKSTEISENLMKKCEKTLETLISWRFDARFMSLEDFLQKLIVKTGYMNYILSLPNGKERGANLRLLVNKAVAFANDGGRSLYSFISYVDSLGKSGVHIPQAIILDDPENTVRIMTIHKSKGLEFPVVIVAGIGNKLKGGKTESVVALHRRLGLGISYVDYNKHIHAETLLQKFIRQKNNNDNLAEEMRIYYVALTRSMDELILVACIKNAEKYLKQADNDLLPSAKNATSFLDWTIGACDDGNIKIINVGITDIAAEKKEERDNRENLREKIELNFPEYKDEKNLMEEFTRRFSYEYPYKGDIHAKAKFTVSELNQLVRNAGSEDEYKENIADEIPEFLKSHESISPVARGTALHRVMQLIPFNEEYKDSTKVSEFINSLIEKNVLTKKEGKALDSEKIARFFSSSLGKKGCNAKYLRREWPFTLKKSKKEIISMGETLEIQENAKSILPENVMIQGVIDCLIYEEDGIIVLDYKTDYVDKKNKEASLHRLKKQYSRQLTLYRDVVEHATKEKVKATLLFLMDIGEVLEI